MAKLGTLDKLYGDMSTDEICELFRQGWEACMHDKPKSDEEPYPWREGWAKAAKFRAGEKKNESIAKN